MFQLKRALWDISEMTFSPVSRDFLAAIEIVDQEVAYAEPYEKFGQLVDRMLTVQSDRRKTRAAKYLRDWLEVDQNHVRSIYTYYTPRGKVRLTITAATRHEPIKYTLEILDCVKMTYEKFTRLEKLLGEAESIAIEGSRKRTDVREMKRLLE